MRIDYLYNSVVQTSNQAIELGSLALSFLRDIISVQSYSSDLSIKTKACKKSNSYPEELDSDAKEIYPDLDIHAWRSEDVNLNGLSLIKNMMGVNGRNKKEELAAQKEINIMKENVDQIRHKKDNNLLSHNFTKNSIGFMERKSSTVVYRVDSRSPKEILENNGFGPSMYVQGILPMIDSPVLITSASLKGTNKVLHDWGLAKCSYQYAIKSDEIKQVSWADNFKFLKEIPDEHGEDFRLDYDESHIDTNKIESERIYILDCSDEIAKERISMMYQTGFAAQRGIKLTDFVEHEKKYSLLNGLIINKAIIDNID